MSPYLDSDYFNLACLSEETSAKVRVLFENLLKRDRITALHSLRVAEVGLVLGRFLGLSQRELAEVYVGSVLHDVGKIQVPNVLLLSPNVFNDREMEQMKAHVIYGKRLLKSLGVPRPILDACAYHHERYDGSGYIKGLAGEGIPPIARLLAVADVYAALTEDRPYRPRMTPAKALLEIDSEGARFDPRITSALRELAPLQSLERIANVLMAPKNRYVR